MCDSVVNVKVKVSTSLLMSHRIPSASAVMVLSLTFWAVSFLAAAITTFSYAYQTCRTVAYLSMSSALQIQDRSPQWRPVTSECVCIGCATRPVLIVAIGLGFATRPRWRYSLQVVWFWMATIYACLHQTNWTQFHSFVIITQICLILILNTQKRMNIIFFFSQVT